MTAPTYAIVMLRLEPADAAALARVVKQNNDKDRTAAIRRLIREAAHDRKGK
jgi:hypothetical protein